MSEKKNITIVDYDCGNLFSLQQALTELGVKSVVTKDPEQIKVADKLILPGVGAFGQGMKHINDYGQLESIKEFVASGKPLLGICLGMQLLLRESFEFGHFNGFGFIQGKVELMDKGENDETKIKIPHIGWSAIHSDNGVFEKNEIFNDVKNGTYMYFLHSYAVSTDDNNHHVATTEYGVNSFCSVAQKDNVVGVQFHPEISGPSGLKLLENFIYKFN